MSSNKPWLFVHIMKTAGTSFRNYLQKTNPGRVYPSQQQLAENPKKGWYLTADEFLKYLERQKASGFCPDDYQFYFGHFPYALSKELDFDVRVAVVLRDPVSRSLSMIKHRKRANPERFEQLTDVEMLYLEDFRECQITNYQTKVIGLSDGLYNVNAGYECNDQTLEKAIHNLTEIDYIGLTENIEGSLKLWQHALEIQGGLEFPWINKSDGHASVSVEFQEAVAPFIEYDKLLYEKAKQIFDEKIKTLVY